MDNLLYHTRQPPLNVSIFITHVRSCVIGAMPIAYLPLDNIRLSKMKRILFIETRLNDQQNCIQNKYKLHSQFCTIQLLLVNMAHDIHAIFIYSFYSIVLFYVVLCTFTISFLGVISLTSRKMSSLCLIESDI